MSLFRKFVEFEMVYIFIFFLLFSFHYYFKLVKDQFLQKFGETGLQPTQSPAPRLLRACVNISDLTCQDCLLIRWLLIKMKGICKYWPLFPLSRGMPNAPVLFTVTCSNNSSTKKWKWFSSAFYHPLPIFCPVPSPI